MYRIIKRILNLAGDKKIKLYAAFVMSFFESICMNIPIIIILFILKDISLGVFSMEKIWDRLWIMVGALVFQYIFNLLVYHFQSGTGYEIISDQRIKIGERLRRLPMGYFSHENVGNIAAVVTSDLSFVETYSMHFLSKVVNAILASLITIIFLFFIDTKMAIISLIVYPAAILLFNNIQNVFKKFALKRQTAQASVISSILEYIHGISVIKSLNLSGKEFGKLDKSLNNFEKATFNFEMKVVPWYIGYRICFQIGTALILYFGPYYYFSGEISQWTFLMFLIIAFKIYMPIEAIGGISGIIRLMDICLDRVEEIRNIPVLDEKDICKHVDGYDIELKKCFFFL